MDHVETKQLADSMSKELALETPSSSDPILFYLPNAQKPVAVERYADLIIGRRDPDSTLHIDVDLGPFEGQMLGVSRQHARINASVLPPILVDLDSYNGTSVNGHKLNPDEPVELQSGDEVQFGRLSATVYYKG
jgi:pSer/pThr/pTyr-binding forkhead associated (FHA) protein